MATRNTADMSSRPSADLLDFPITRKWAPIHPGRLQLYAFGTPNGVKIPIALEELGIAYEPQCIPLNAENVIRHRAYQTFACGFYWH